MTRSLPGSPARRRWLAAAAGAPLAATLAGCGTPLPLGTPAPTAGPAPDRDAEALLAASAEAHGWTALQGLRDIAVRYEGEWQPFIDAIQPEVVDAGFRGASEERLLLREAINAQAYTGPKGRKFVHWQRGADAASGRVAVWFNGQPASGPALPAAALVAEGYGLFLLGPLWLKLRGAVPLARAGRERVDGRSCDVLQAWLRPGLGRSALDRVELCIDRDDATTRRVRFTLEGFERTQGAVAEVDTFAHERRFGVLWPRRSFERVVHPLRLPAHDWRLAGLDVNRGMTAADVAGPVFTGAAAAPARAL